MWFPNVLIWAFRKPSDEAAECDLVVVMAQTKVRPILIYEVRLILQDNALVVWFPAIFREIHRPKTLSSGGGIVSLPFENLLMS